MDVYLLTTIECSRISWSFIRQTRPNQGNCLFWAKQTVSNDLTHNNINSLVWPCLCTMWCGT